MKIRTAFAAALLLAALAGCGSGTTASDGARPGSATPTPTKRAFDVHDCRALLERDYDADTLHDASKDPECKALTHDEYLNVVKEVLTGRKDEILDDAAQHVVWDQAWTETDQDRREVVCSRLLEDGVEVVGKEMVDAAGDETSGDELEMSQYYLDEKC